MIYFLFVLEIPVIFVLQIFSHYTQRFENWGISSHIIPTFSWGILSHMTRLDHLHASKKI